MKVDVGVRCAGRLEVGIRFRAAELLEEAALS